MNKGQYPILKILLLVFCSLLFVPGCQNPLNPSLQENTSKQADIPEGMGSLRVSINAHDMARTILPNTPTTADFFKYNFVFSPTSGGSPLSDTRLAAGLLTTFNLAPGTYTLVVTAFVADNKPAAQGIVAGIGISAGVSTDADITLKAIITAGLDGSFKYTVTFPLDVTTAAMKITPLNTLTGTTVPDVDLLDGGSDTATDTLSLKTGYYNVVFTLEKDRQKLVWRELLHIYANLESVFTRTFQDADFFYTHYTVTFNFNNEDANGEETVVHGGKAVEKTPTKPSNVFDGWYTTSTFTGAAYDFDTPVFSDLTLYAKWTVNEDGLAPATAWKVKNETDLRAVGRGGTAGYDTGAYVDWTLDKYYEQVSDITLTTGNWTPIGTSGAHFSGSYDGGNNTISNLVIDNSTAEFQSMFGYISGGLVKNLGLVSCSIKGSDDTGGIAGINSNGGTIDNCFSSGDVSGDYNVGGIVGNNQATVINCYYTGGVSGIENIGGVAGNSEGNEFKNCYSTGDVEGYESVGGVVGYITSDTVEYCYSTGSVSGTNLVGGVVGNSDGGKVTNCYSTGDVSGSGDHVGGILGHGPDVSNCYATGNVSGGDFVGGVVGKGSGMSNCLALCPTTTGTGVDIGRVTGKDFGALTNNYARSDMALIGGTETPTANGKDGSNVDANTTGSGARIQSFWQSTANFDFTNIWEWNSTTNLPILRNMPAGAQNPELQFLPTGTAVFTITDAIVKEAGIDPLQSNLSLSRGTGGKTAVITVENESLYTDIDWTLSSAGGKSLGTGSTLTISIDPDDTVNYIEAIDYIAKHLISVVLCDTDGVPYSIRIEFEVTP